MTSKRRKKIKKYSTGNWKICQELELRGRGLGEKIVLYWPEAERPRGKGGASRENSQEISSFMSNLIDSKVIFQSQL